MKFKVWKEGKINKNCITLWGKRWQRSILFLKYLCNLYGTEILKDFWSYSAENKIMNSSVWQKWHRMRLKSFHEEKNPKNGIFCEQKNLRFILCFPHWWHASLNPQYWMLSIFELAKYKAFSKKYQLKMANIQRELYCSKTLTFRPVSIFFSFLSFKVKSQNATRYEIFLWLLENLHSASN
jgi:hypothetical protein